MNIQIKNISRFADFPRERIHPKSQNLKVRAHTWLAPLPPPSSRDLQGAPLALLVLQEPQPQVTAAPVERRQHAQHAHRPPLPREHPGAPPLYAKHASQVVFDRHEAPLLRRAGHQAGDAPQLIGWVWWGWWLGGGQVGWMGRWMCCFECCSPCHLPCCAPPDCTELSHKSASKRHALTCDGVQRVGHGIQVIKPLPPGRQGGCGRLCVCVCVWRGGGDERCRNSAERLQSHATKPNLNQDATPNAPTPTPHHHSRPLTMNPHITLNSDPPITLSPSDAR